jgi:hypothetical protein
MNSIHLHKLSPLLGLVAMACGGTQALPVEASASAIRAAEESGAEKVPRASLHLQLAKEEMDRSQALAKNGEKDQAVSLLQRAEVDAELAVVLAHEQKEKAAAADAVERVRQLQHGNQ